MPEPRLRTARTVDGVTIAWTEMGSGPPLVVVPTMPLGNMSGEQRIPFMSRASDALARRVRLIRYDGRGNGRSQRDVTDVSLDAMLRDLDAVAEAAHLGRFALLATYHGCTIALAWAARNPERLTGLILFGGSARTWDAMSDARTQALLSLIDRDWDLFVESAAHAWLGWSGGEAGRLLAASFRDAVAPATARAMLDEARTMDVHDALGRVTAPTMVLHRTGSAQMPEEVSAELVAALPDARLVHLPGATPGLFFEHPADDVDVITSFVVDGRSPRSMVGPSTPAARPGGLTAREIEVLRLIAAGESNAVIAHRLGVTVNTVERHAANLYRKIDARGRADATAWAVRHGVT